MMGVTQLLISSRPRLNSFSNIYQLGNFVTRYVTSAIFMHEMDTTRIETLQCCSKAYLNIEYNMIQTCPLIVLCFSISVETHICVSLKC